jgi:hypothetical protein
MSGTDTWVTYENLISKTGNHSWIVLRQAAIGGGSGLEICFDFADDTTVYDELSIVVSYAVGFTGGSLSARPTATDEHVYQNMSSDNWGGRASPYQSVVNRIFSTDGKVSRFLCSLDTYYVFWCLEALKNPYSYVDPNFVFTAKTGMPERLTMGYSTDAFYTRVSGVDCGGRITLQTYENASTKSWLFSRESLQRPDAAGKYNMFPVGVACTTSPFYGKMGDLYDWYESATLPPGTYLPTPTDGFGFVSFGDFMFANDGTLLIL